MERIKQALEKARLERQNAGGGRASPLNSDKSIVSEPLTYTHTRTIPVAKSFLRERRIIAGMEQNAFTESYKMLRTQVLQRLRENKWNSLAITSPGLHEGKTLTAINLAISLAMEVNYTVLLVDADLRSPSVHSFFGIDIEKGLSDYLAGEVSVSELLVHPDEIPDFVILPAGKPIDNSAEMLNSPKMAKLVEELETRYPSRIVLFDLPPLLNAADTLAFSPYVDAALLVIEDGKTQTDDAKRAIDLLQGTNVIGTVLNKTSTSIQRYGESSSGGPADRLQNRVHLFRATLIDWLSRLRRKQH